MATVLDDKAKAAVEENGSFGAAVINQAPTLVKGAGYLGTSGRGWAPLEDPKEITERSANLVAAVYKSVKTSHETPDAIKGMINPAFTQEFSMFGAGFGEWQAQRERDQVLGELAKTVLGKNITTASPLSTGFVPYDLLAPTKLIYPYYTVLRNKIGRSQAQGLKRQLKLITGISGSHTPSGSNLFSDITTSEITNFATNPGAGATTNFGSQTAAEFSIPYKAMIQTEVASWLAQFQGQGFDDVVALINLILVQEFTNNEEGLMLYGTGTALGAPATVTGTARTANSNETALTGVTTNVTAYVTAWNEFGESAATSSGTVAVSAGQVVDLTIATVPGAAGYRVYLGTNTAAAGASFAYTFSGNQMLAGVVSGPRLTLQGAVPTTGANAGGAQVGAGSSASTRYEGFLSVLSGWASTNAVYPANWQGGYVNQSVKDVLNQNAVNTALKGMWSGGPGGLGFRADPTEIVGEGRDLAAFGNDILTNGHSTNYVLRLQQSEMGSLTGGGAIEAFLNPITRSRIGLTVHPFLAQGTALIMSYTVPHPNANVGQTWENAFVQDLMSIKWPVTDMSFRFSIFALGALVAQAPQYCGLLQGIQLNASTPYA